jgi:hypothetical protein
MINKLLPPPTLIGTFHYLQILCWGKTCFKLGVVEATKPCGHNENFEHFMVHCLAPSY